MDKADFLSKIFSSNSTPDFPTRTHSILSDLIITPNLVPSAISKLDISKATGPDGIPEILFQKCSPEISPVLSKLYIKCLS